MVELYIDGVGWECASLQRIEVGYNAADMVDVTSGRTRLDIPLSIECSAENWTLLSGEVYPHTYPKFNDSFRQGELKIDDEEIFSGQVVLTGVEWSGDDGDTITMNFTILGDTDDWAHIVALSAFSSTPVDYTRQLNEATIKSSWEEGSAVTFLPVNRDEAVYEIPSTQAYIITKVRSSDDYLPFLHLRGVIDAIFSATGYSVESEFMDSDLFNRLYMSGSYGYTESSVAHSRMGFNVSRVSSKTTTAGTTGRVYASPYFSFNSVGNLVEMDSIESRDDCYSNGGAISENDGVIEFTPLYSTSVGFEFRFAYVATYRIESRETLSTFNRIYVGDSVLFEFSLFNCFEDERETTLRTNFSYMVVPFGHVEGRAYRLVNASTGDVILSFSDTHATFSLTTSANVSLHYLSGSSYYNYEDWAIYSGGVAYQGQMEIDVTFTSPPSNMSAGSVHSFGNIFFDGAEEGDSFELLERTSIRPLFATYPGYGSYFSFDDVARHDISQGELLASLQHLFNLRFYTDSGSKRVYIEPRDDFYGDDLWDWRERVILEDGVEFSPVAATVSQKRTWCYQQGEAAMEQYLSCSVEDYGVWSSETSSQVATQGSQSYYNQIFYPSANDSDGVLYAGERYDDSMLDSLNITPRIVQRVGYCDVPMEGELPYATFHDGEYTLCFEDRDGVQGLNRYYTMQVAQEGRSDYVTLSVRLAPQELNSLFTLGCASAPSIRSQFTISLHGEECRGTIERIDWYDADRYVARVTFLLTD